MTPERWQRVKQLLGPALELDPAKRADYLDQACGSDPTLRHDLERLLAAEQRAGADFLNDLVLSDEWSAELPQRDDRWIGRRLGPYQIVEEIGVGGMGEVYRAVRADDEYRKEVAIKLVRSDQDTGFVLSRFKKERQILASLDHPNIARLLDGGTTQEGAPYFVMELIEGERINKYCDARKLATTERLKLFLLVCSAVEYAHQHLVIHRDIKPGNIIVNGEGVPKLLDFGIAKILESSEVSIQPEQTISLLRLLTPDYASPEQVKGEPITTASDVYSLGVVLYELLTGRTPYNVSTHTPHELSRAICETEPEKPSMAARQKQIAAGDREKQMAESALSAAREGSAEKLSKRLSGDLDNILLMALRKEPQRRYASVEQFAQDIRRHLGHLPVVARKDTFGYRASKFIARHKAGVAAAALITVALLSSTGVTLRQARIARANELRAERRFNDVRQLANSLMFEVHDSIKDLAGATPARKLLVEKALQYLDSLSQEAGGDISLQRELASAYEKVGNVQGNPYAANLGDTAGALASYHKALAIRESLPTDNSEVSHRSLANDYEWIGMAMENLGNYQGALEYYRKGFSIQDVLTKTAPSAKSQERLAGAYFLMARDYSDLQDPKSALENYRRSAAIRETIATGSLFVQSRLAGTYSYMAGILLNLGDLTQAVLLQRKSLEITKKLSDADPTNATNREFLDEAYYWTGFYLERNGDFVQALLNYRYALADLQTLASADPKEVRTKEYVARCHKSIGTTLVAEGNITQGLQSIRRALSIFQELRPVEITTQFVADTYDAIGLAYSRQAAKPGLSSPARIANWKQARAAYQKSLDNWMESKNRGGLTAFDVGEPDRIRSELAKCDAALAKLTAPPH